MFAVCLAAVDKEKPASEGIGYKVLSTVTLHGGRVLLQTPIVKRNIVDGWNVTNSLPSTLLFAETGEQYETGFHIWKNLQDAENYRPLLCNRVICRVRYRNATASGPQRVRWSRDAQARPVFGRPVFGQCIVAREMLVEGEITTD